VKVAIYQYLFAGLLALVVVLVYRAVGVLLVTAMLVVPAATARNFSRSAGGMFWWALMVSLSSAVAGLIISAQEWADTATGATVILVAFAWFLLSVFISSFSSRNRVNQ
jgi:zinc transport system permease protein